MDLETVMPDPSAISLANDETTAAKTGETIKTNGSRVIPNEGNGMSEVGPSVDDSKDVIENIEPEDQTTTAREDVGVKTEGHKVSVDDAVAILPKATTSEAANDTLEGKSASERSNSGQQTRGRGGKYGNKSDRPYKNYRENVKSDLTSQEESSDPIAIRKQVEFYFSDSNIPMDNYLYNKVQGPENLPVPIAMLHSFKRMRHFQPFSTIVDALKDSTFLEVIENEHDEMCVRRRIPISGEFKDKPKHEIEKVYESKAMARSVYVKGFGQEQSSTQFDIEAFFAEHGPTNSVRLRRTPEKYFKGSVFVEFDSEETQKAFLKLKPEPKWKGKHLHIKSKKQYCDEKVEDIKAGRIKPRQREHHQKGNRDGRNGDKQDRDWRVRRDEDRRQGFKGGNRRGRGGGKEFGSKGGKGRDDYGRDAREKGRNEERKKLDADHTVPRIATSTPEPAGEVRPSGPSMIENSKKRARENDDSADLHGATATKRIDVKVEPESDGVAVAAVPGVKDAAMSKKRARGDEDEGGNERTKRVDVREES